MTYLHVDACMQVYPLFATTGVAVGICVMQLVRNITTNPAGGAGDQGEPGGRGAGQPRRGAALLAARRA